MSRWLIITNPNAGGGRCGKLVDTLLPRIARSGLELEVVHTRGPGDAQRLASEHFERGCRQFVAIGGDGTNFEILNGVFPRALEDPVRLATIPLGTGNSLLRDFGIFDADAAVRSFLRQRFARIDVIECRHAEGTLFFINLLGVGFSARVGALTNKHFKPLGAQGYIVAVLCKMVVMEYPSFPVRIDGADDVDDRPCSMLSFCNTRFTGGDMMMAPMALPADGLLDVIRIGPLGSLRLARCLPRIFTGTHPELPEVETLRARRVDFVEPVPVDVMVDGEIIRLTLESLEVRPGALELCA